ncbi:G-protein coupled receptor Mth2 isoform X1 [Spodoptera frugiperda]|uniref:G-protein coupled receptor Mth2 isoform X1 n=1 Tax=Spodoptera frugiperda TaxID=7108 RepID=A0A9R0EJY2_SPOFR|nr:G-protein coupled receptor Mth2 isoform X1 [Spodoptera frugiperda]
MYREWILFPLLIVFTTASTPYSYINKCCRENYFVSVKKSCIPANRTTTFPPDLRVYNKKIEYVGTFNDVFHLRPQMFADLNFGSAAVDIQPMPNIGLYIIENGGLEWELPNSYKRWNEIPPSNFCIDYRFNPRTNKTRLGYWITLPPSPDTPKSSIYLTSATLVSCFFMLLVLIVYFLLPELQNLCGLILMAYVASLFMAFLLLAIIQIKIHPANTCIGLTFSIYFFFLASFCWMSVMSYDIWWTFRGYAKARPIHRRGERFKFMMYCLYAWGLPLAMTIALAVLNSVDMKHVPWFVTPHVPSHGCFLEGGEKLLYLYMPMLILILCNWMFYLMTAFNIWRLSRGTAMLDTAAAGTPQAHRTHRQRFMVYLKLSIVMGLNWLLEIISFLYPGFKMWYITDAYNILIGLAIFLIFVCKKKILKKLIKRYLHFEKMHWNPSSKSYTSSISDSNQESVTLQSKVSSQPNGIVLHNRSRMD